MSTSNREYRNRVQELEADRAEQHRIASEKIGMITKVTESYSQQQADFMQTIQQAGAQRKAADNAGITFRHSEINN